MKSPFTAKVTSVATAIVVVILVLVPFHAFLTVWAASAFGNYDALRLWEEVLLLVLAAAVAWILLKDAALWKVVKQSWLFRLMAAYVLLHALLGTIALARHQVNMSALMYSLVVNLRLMLFFFAAWVVANRSEWLRAHWRKVVFIPAGIVVAFGLLQAFILSPDFLRHFGYGPKTIMPYETVDQKLQYLRVQSTLRGANPLGAYLVLIIAAVSAGLLRRKQSGKNIVMEFLFCVAVLAALYFTYSRSAYVGAAVACVGVVWLLARSQHAKQWLLVVAMILAVLGGGATLALRHNDHFENTFFHTDEHSRSGTSSNQKRSSALQDGLHDVVHQPLGSGPGTAGPASVHNNHPARLAENYYLQLGQELGWLGIVLFALINILIGAQLWHRRNEKLAVVLLASLAGISCVNMLSHAWTDDTLAYVWWGLAGIALTPAILKQKQNSRSNEPKKTYQETDKSA